jgi:cell division protein ZapA (FtsZ GTPase activity inhibitor)
MTVHNEGLEYNILGCNVRIKKDEAERDNALKAIEDVNNEIEKMRSQNSKLKDIDVAVLIALKFASDKSEIESEYKENIFSLKAGVNDALSFIEEVSPGSMQTNKSE